MMQKSTFYLKLKQTTGCFTDYPNFSFDVSHGKKKLGVSLWAETLFQEQTFKEQLLYQSFSGAVSRCEETLRLPL